VKLQQDLKEFIKLLTSHGVEFIVVGGHAVAFHGHPRFTGDIDFLLRPTLANAERVMETLEAFGFTGLALTIDDFQRPERVIQLGRSPNRIDLLTSISGVDFEEAWITRVGGELDGLSVSFLGLEALLKNKMASGRDKDQADVKKLQAIAAKAAKR
jgi:predicted nucleotidyltransferase